MLPPERPIAAFPSYHVPSITRTLPAFLLLLAMAFALSPMLAGQQHRRRPISEVRPYTSIDDILNREALAADPAGIQQFSEDLIGLLVPERAGEDYIESLANRLAKAEQLTREGKGKLVPEMEIVQVFNNTMQKIGAPFKTDEATVRKFREHSIAVLSLPALLTANRNGTNCTPAEAVYLFYLLSWANGDLPLSVLDNEADLKRLEVQGKTPLRVMGIGTGPLEKNGGDMLTVYSMHHRRQATTRLFNNIAHAFGF